jgi:hypothetical protein
MQLKLILSLNVRLSLENMLSRLLTVFKEQPDTDKCTFWADGELIVQAFTMPGHTREMLSNYILGNISGHKKPIWQQNFTDNGNSVVS